MRQLRALWRLARALLHIVYGVGMVRWQFRFLDEAGRYEHIAWFARRMLHVMGLSLRAQGQFGEGPKLVVANHISWVDIVAIQALCPRARFVSKADVQHWPLVKWLAAAAGTLYLQRESRRDALRVVHQVAQALSAGDTVAVFPEGTTGDGRVLLPFHANLLQPAITTCTPVQPVVLRFSDGNGEVSAAAEFLGDTTLVQSAWRLACGSDVVVSVEVLPLQPSANIERRVLADRLRGLIAARLPSDV